MICVLMKQNSKRTKETDQVVGLKLASTSILEDLLFMSVDWSCLCKTSDDEDETR